MNKDKHKKLISLFFLFSIISLIAFFLVSYFQYYRLFSTHKSLIKSYQTIRAVNQTLISLDEAALNTSLFLQDRVKENLNIIPESIITAQLNFETLQQLVQDNPEEINILVKLTPLLQTKILFWKRITTEFTAGNYDTIYQIITDKNRVRLTKTIREYLIAIKQLEIKQLERNEIDLLDHKMDAKKIVIFMGLLCAFFFVCSFALLDKYLKTY